MAIAAVVIVAILIALATGAYLFAPSLFGKGETPLPPVTLAPTAVLTTVPTPVPTTVATASITTVPATRVNTSLTTAPQVSSPRREYGYG